MRFWKREKQVPEIPRPVAKGRLPPVWTLTMPNGTKMRVLRNDIMDTALNRKPTAKAE